MKSARCFGTTQRVAVLAGTLVHEAVVLPLGNLLESTTRAPLTSHVLIQENEHGLTTSGCNKLLHREILVPTTFESGGTQDDDRFLPLPPCALVTQAYPWQPSLPGTLGAACAAVCERG